MTILTDFSNPTGIAGDMNRQQDDGYDYSKYNQDTPPPPSIGGAADVIPPVDVTGTRPGITMNNNTPLGDQPPPTDPSQGGGGGGIWDWIQKNVLGQGGSGNLFGIGPDLATRGLYTAGAYNDWKNSDRYMDLAGKYAQQMDPFGAQRAYYQGRLKQLTEDPNAYLKSSPDYQAAFQQGIDAKNRAAAGAGQFGTGTESADVMRFGSQLGAQYLNQDRQSLMQMAGSQIGPSAAADLIKTGMIGSIQSRNNALANLGRAAFPNTTGGGGPGGGGGGPGGGSNPGLTGIFDAVKQAGGGPAAIAKGVAGLVARGWSQNDAQAAIQAMLKGTGTNWTQNGQPYDPITNPDGYHPYPTQGSPTSGQTQPGDTFTDPNSGMTYIFDPQQGWIPMDMGGGYVPGEPGFDTGGSTPPDFTPPYDIGGGFNPES